MVIKKVLAFALLFSFIYQISYVFLPFNMPFVLGFIGLPLYVYNSSAIRNKDRKYVEDILLALLPVVIVALLSIVGNHSSDFYFVKWAIINVLYFFGAYFLYQLLKESFEDFSFVRLVDLFALCAVVQLSISLVMYFSPEVKDVLQSVIHESEIAKEAMERGTSRMIGFGTHFFLSGTVHAFILMMISFSFMYRKVSHLKSVVMILAYVYIAIVGTMMARTTLIGVLFSIVIILSMRKGKSLFIIGLITSIITIMSMFIFDSKNENLNVLINFGFESFTNYQKTGIFSTQSTESMFSMYKFPSIWETWLWGDARYEAGRGYYMNTDIGYCRLIFYFGVIGFITYMYFEYYILKKIFPPRKYGHLTWSILLCFVFAINGKGTYDIFPYVCLFGFFIHSCSPRCNNIKGFLDSMN